MTGRRAAHEHEIPVQPGPQNAPVSLNRSYDYFADSLTVWIGSLALVNLVFPPFQMIGRLVFSTPSLTTRFIKKFVQNVTSFVVTYFINISCSSMT